MQLRSTLLKLAIVLVPSYAAAYLTGEMVWVVPTLVASGILAANLGSVERTATRRVDEDGQEEDGEDDGEETLDE